MASCASFQIHLTSVMEVLTKTAVAEITKLVEDESAALRLEMCRSQTENEALKRRLLLMDRELRALQGGCNVTEGTPDNSVNICFAVQVCDEFREAPKSKIAAKGSVVAVESDFDEPLSTAPVKNDPKAPMEKKTTATDALVIKYEAADEEQNWSESLLLGEDRLGEDPERSQSQAENISTLGAAAAYGGEGPLCEEEELHMQTCPAGDPGKQLQAELKQEPEGQPHTPAPPLLGSIDLGLELPPVITWEKRGHGGQSPPSEESLGASAEGGMEGREEFICTCCGKTFPDAAELETHEEEHGAGTRVSCPETGRALLYSSMLEKHLPIHSKEESLDGSGWDRSFSQCDVLQAQERFHTGQKPYVCTVCGKLFRYKGYLKIHQRVHTREKPFTCTQCGTSFSQISSLKTHLITHTRKKSLSCTVCNWSCSSLTGLLEHHQSVHAWEKCLICKLCGKLFDGEDSLEQHSLAHEREKQFRCTLCGKGFTSKSNLKSHQRVHTGEKPHHCNECGRSFAHLCNLKTHQRVHTGERPFSCTLCGRGFSQNHVLQRHMLSHTKE